MSGLAGLWDLLIATPLGKIEVILQVTDVDGVLQGTATSKGETVEMQDVVVDGACARWAQRVTKPMKLTLQFDVTFDADDLAGTSKAGRLPASKVTGHRRSGV